MGHYHITQIEDYEALVGTETVRKNFLLTRYLEQHLDLFGAE